MVLALVLFLAQLVVIGLLIDLRRDVRALSRSGVDGRNT
jgi:hypothetical protein